MKDKLSLALISMSKRAKYNAINDWYKLRGWFKRNLNTILITSIAVMVGIILLILVVQNSNARREVENHRRATEELTKHTQQLIENEKRNAEAFRQRNEDVHNEIKDFLCELVRLAPPERITLPQLELCKGYPPPEGQERPKALPRQGASQPAPSQPEQRPAPRPSPNRPAPVRPAPKSSPKSTPRPTPPSQPPNPSKEQALPQTRPILENVQKRTKKLVNGILKP